MARKALGWIALIFFGFVAVDYLLNLAGGVLGGALAHRPLSRGGAAPYELASINFGFFGKGGAGQSYITQGYGRTGFSYRYKDGWHNGVDIAAAYGAPIHSPGEGLVIATGDQDFYCPRRGFGKYVAIKDGANRLVLWYAHLGAISVALGDAVKKGALIGTVGATGFETGTHLHFSIFDANGFKLEPRNGCGPDAVGRDLDPLSYLGTTYQ